MENSVLFASYGFASRLIHAGDADGMPFSKKLVAGGFSGFCVAAVLTPVELIKCKMQTANESVRACFAVHIWVWGLGLGLGARCRQLTSRCVHCTHHSCVEGFGQTLTCNVGFVCGPCTAWA